MNRKPALFVAVLVTLAVTEGCGGTSVSPNDISAAVALAKGSPTPAGQATGSPVPTVTPKPVPTPDLRAPVMAPPPAGVSPGVWLTGCSSDGLLRYPDEVLVSLPVDVDASIRLSFVNLATKIGSVSRIPVSVVVGGTDSLMAATFPVSIVPDLVCQGKDAGACTTVRSDSSGRVIGGEIKFRSVTYMRFEHVVMHELVRTLGITTSSPVSGVTSNPPWLSTEFNDQEAIMIPAREALPRLSQCSPT